MLEGSGALVLTLVLPIPGASLPCVDASPCSDRRSRPPGDRAVDAPRSARLAPGGTGKRTHYVLPKPDMFICFRHEFLFRLTLLSLTTTIDSYVAQDFAGAQ